MSQRGVNRLWILFALQLVLVDADQFLAPAGVLAKAIVGDPIEPGRKFRLAAEAPDVLVGAHESLLRQIIGQGEIAPCELAQQPADGGLMPPHQLSKSVVIILKND